MIDATLSMEDIYSPLVNSVKPPFGELTSPLVIGILPRMGKAATPKSELEMIAANLKRLEAALELEPMEVADAAEIPRNTYSGWRNARKRPEVTQAFKLETTFGATLSYVYRGVRTGMTGELQTKLATAELQLKKAKKA